MPFPSVHLNRTCFGGPVKFPNGWEGKQGIQNHWENVTIWFPSNAPIHTTIIQFRHTVTWILHSFRPKCDPLHPNVCNVIMEESCWVPHHYLHPFKTLFSFTDINCFTAPLGHASINRRVLRHIASLWDNFWMKQQASPGQGPLIRYYFYYLHVLEVFQFPIYPVDTWNGCSSVTAYFQSVISSLHVPLSNFHPPWTLSHLPFLPNHSI